MDHVESPRECCRFFKWPTFRFKQEPTAPLRHAAPGGLLIVDDDIIQAGAHGPRGLAALAADLHTDRARIAGAVTPSQLKLVQSSRTLFLPDTPMSEATFLSEFARRFGCAPKWEQAGFDSVMQLLSQIPDVTRVAGVSPPHFILKSGRRATVVATGRGRAVTSPRKHREQPVNLPLHVSPAHARDNFQPHRDLFPNRHNDQRTQLELGILPVDQPGPQDGGRQVHEQRVPVARVVPEEKKYVNEFAAGTGRGVPVHTPAMVAPSAETALRVPLEEQLLKEGFRVLRVVGTGSTGSVFKAEFLTTGELCAIKILPSHNDAQRTHAMKEVSFTRMFQGPHVVKFVAALELHSAIALVTRYYPGGTLADEIRAHPAGYPRKLLWRRIFEIYVLLKHVSTIDPTFGHNKTSQLMSMEASGCSTSGSPSTERGTRHRVGRTTSRRPKTRWRATPNAHV